jgi:hypothetical protein
VRRVVRGIRRTIGAGQRQKAPATAEISTARDRRGRQGRPRSGSSSARPPHGGASASVGRAGPGSPV